MHRLLQILTENKLLTASDLAMIHEQVTQHKVPLIHAIQIVIAQAKESLLPQTINVIAATYNLPLFQIQEHDLARLPVNLLAAEVVQQEQILPVSLNHNILTLALTDPEQQQIIHDIKFKQGLNIKLMFIALEDFHYAVLAHQGNVQHDSKNIDQNPEIISLCNKILGDAVTLNASDIHLEPVLNNQLKIRYRINGDLMTSKTVNSHSKDAIIAHIKLLANLDIAEKRLPQDGRITMQLPEPHQHQHTQPQYTGTTIEFRVSTLNSIFGEKIVLRMMGHNIDIHFNKLGLNPTQEQILKTQLRQSQGMILVTGPTGSGKSLTLYACLHYLNDSKKNIMTIEDPVEMIINDITQVNIHEKIGITFSAILRNFLRQDPDIIMVGEMRDSESAQLAVNAAQTGHLILSTLHTNNSIAAITRLLNLGIASYNIADSLSLVIAQRLVKKLCEYCKTAAPIAPKLLKQLYDKLAQQIHLSSLSLLESHYYATGCKKCNGTGYNGRTAVFEFLPIDDYMRNLINNSSSSGTIAAYCREKKYPSLAEQAITLFNQGLIDLQTLQYF